MTFWDSMILGITSGMVARFLAAFVAVFLREIYDFARSLFSS